MIADGVGAVCVSHLRAGGLQLVGEVGPLAEAPDSFVAGDEAHLIRRDAWYD
jgi:hypothetical protein